MKLFMLFRPVSSRSACKTPAVQSSGFQQNVKFFWGRKQTFFKTGLRTEIRTFGFFDWLHKCRETPDPTFSLQQLFSTKVKNNQKVAEMPKNEIVLHTHTIPLILMHGGPVLQDQGDDNTLNNQRTIFVCDNFRKCIVYINLKWEPSPS